MIRSSYYRGELAEVSQLGDGRNLKAGTVVVSEVG